MGLARPTFSIHCVILFTVLKLRKSSPLQIVDGYILTYACFSSVLNSMRGFCCLLLTHSSTLNLVGRGRRHLAFEVKSFT